MSVTFEKATKKQARARVAITGPAGAGKTYTALRLATGMGGRIAVIDTEHGSASKYAGDFDFDVLQLTNFHPERYVEAIKAAEAAGFDVLVIDSASHEWNGIGGCLELVDAATPRAGGNSYAAWKDVTPLHNRFIEAIHATRCHVFATFRSKMDYVQGERNGRKTVEKLGMAPVTRDGAEYEFDIVLDVDISHTGVVSKSRAKALADSVHKKPGEELAAQIKAWLSDGVEVPSEKIAPTREADTQGARAPDATPLASTSNAPLAPAPPVDGHGAGGQAKGFTASPPPRTPSQIADDARKHIKSPQADYAPEDMVCASCGKKEFIKPYQGSFFCSKRDGGCGAPQKGAKWVVMSYGQWEERQARPLSEKLDEAVDRARRV